MVTYSLKDYWKDFLKLKELGNLEFLNKKKIYKHKFLFEVFAS